MVLTRSEYVKICQSCQKSSFDSKKGVVCSLTNEHANFEGTCPDYSADEKSIKRAERVEKMYEEENISSVYNQPSHNPSSTYKNSSSKTVWNKGFIGGLLMLIGGIVWIVVGLAINRIFFYPIFLIIAGIVSMTKAGNQKVQEMKKPDKSEILDDPDDLEII